MVSSEPGGTAEKETFSNQTSYLNLLAFLGSNAVALAAVAKVGAIATKAVLNALIITSPHVNSCPAPSGRKRSPAELARLEHKCDFGLTKCGLFTGIPPSKGDRDLSLSTTTSTSITRDDALLGAYECLDTMTHLESCGGCVEPYTLGLTPAEVRDLKPGVDCTADEGVSDVECRRGQCVVNKCRKGYELLPLSGAAGEQGLFECVRVGSVHKQVGGTLEWKRE